MKKLILITFAIICGTITTAQVPQIERDALMALFNSTDGANWIDNTNWGSGNPVSTWFGIVVEDIAGTDHVTELNMEFNNLVGTIPPEIGNLSEINRLIFWSNELTGIIPPALGNCLKMKVISLEDNNLSGGIPLELANWNQLEHFWLNDNNLSGDVTTIFSSFTNLNFLGLYNLPLVTGNLDLRNCTIFRGYWGFNTGINTIDVRNGNNVNMTTFMAADNSGLTCIFVDDKNNIPTNWQKDPTATYVQTQAECDALNISEFNETFFSIYPNPTSKFLNIQSNSGVSINQITITNISGQLINTVKSKTNIDVYALSPGLYFLQIKTDMGTITKKFIKE